MEYEVEYPDFYRAYFEYRAPFTENLEDFYKKAVVIPIYHIEELFNAKAINDIHRLNEISGDPNSEEEYNRLNNALKERDLHIFTYFHFIATQKYVLHELRARYRDYYELDQTLKQFEAIGYDVSKARETDLNERKKALLDFQIRLCSKQLA